EEAEAAEVDGQDRDAVRRGLACRSEQRTVAAENEQQVGLRGELFTCETRTAAVAQRFSGFRVVKRAVAAFCEPFQQRSDDVREVGAPWTRKDPDSANGFCG